MSALNCVVTWGAFKGTAYFNIQIKGVLYTYACLDDTFMLIKSDLLVGNISMLETQNWVGELGDVENEGGALNE